MENENTTVVTETAPVSAPKKSEVIKARRLQNDLAVEQFVASMTKPLGRADISRGVDEVLGRIGDGNSWNDTGKAIMSLLKDGKLVESKAEGKKKTLYMKVVEEPKVEEVQEEAGQEEIAG
jgi:hypothetical protein